MSCARAGYFIGLMICLPLFVHAWGLLYNSVPPVGASQVIAESCKWLWMLLATALLVSTPWFVRDFSSKQVVIAHAILVMASMPFMALVWLADVISNIILLKFLGSLLILSLSAVLLVWSLNHFRIFDRLPIKLDMPFCLMATICFWKAGDLWFSWLM